jgi:predicted DCC family thiol-disulfide oxidoreductase YuxK
MVRAAVSAFFLFSVLTTSFSNLGQLPATLLRPLGVMQLVSWRFYDLLLTPRGMSWFKWAVVISLSLSTIGYLTIWTTKSSALLVLFYEGLLRSLGHFNHDEMLGVYCLVILAFSPCGDGFSVDALARRRANKGEVAYGYPILLMQLLVAWSYFSSALIKFRVSGFGYFSKDNLPALAILHSLDNLHDTHFRFAFSLPAIRDYLPIVVVLVVLWELFFPLGVFWKRLRWWFLGIGILFHLSTLFLMNIFFPFHLAMYSVFVNWPEVAAWFSNRRFLRRPVSWWRRFRSVPEEFPDLRINGLSNEGLLLWDGDCGFCSAMVMKMKRFGRRPFAESPYQSIKAQLPESILHWSNRQAHWIDSEGRVTGGSCAFIGLLDQSGRPFWAALLSSAPFRPLLWIGYRFVAANRGWLARFFR